jgi:hypothetical protein
LFKPQLKQFFPTVLNTQWLKIRVITEDLLEALPGVFGDVGGCKLKDWNTGAGADRLTA